MNFKDPPDTILLCCAGLGMGNASRMIAIVEALAELANQNHIKLNFHIVTWGAGYKFLQRYQTDCRVRFELLQVAAYPAWPHLFGMVSAYLRNVLFLLKIVRRLKPRVIVLDSDYHFPAFFGAGAPIIYVGQANDVVTRADTSAHAFGLLRERLNFLINEKLDAFIQHRFSHMVLVPCFSGANTRAGKIVRIPLIVRKEFLDFTEVNPPVQEVGVLLSGSEREQTAFLALADKYCLSVLANIPSHASALDKFDVLLTQGGLSSISECVARSKFLVVVPMRGHAEQILNAREVENLGLGMSSSVDELGRFPQLIEKIKRTRHGSKPNAVPCNGADVAAKIIFQNLQPH